MSTSTSRVRRKPPPPTPTTSNVNLNVVYPIQQVPSLSQPQQQQQQPQLSNQPLQKLSFSERYPDPDPTDPFAPLWVLRNRTSSALHKEPTQTYLLNNNREQQQPPETTTATSSSRQPDRRRSASASYLHTITPLALKPITSPASDHGHSITTTIRAGRTSSVDNNNGNRFTLRRQSIRPIIPLGLVNSFGLGTTHAPGPGPIITSTSRSSIEPGPPQLYPNPNPKHMHIRILQPHPHPHPHLDNNNDSGTDSDSTRVHHGGGGGSSGNNGVYGHGYGHTHAHGRGSTLEMERSSSITTNTNTTRPCSTPLQSQTQSNNRQRTGSANKLVRFLRPSRKNSQGQGQTTDGGGGATIRASIADIDRIRKSSISPPVFSTVVWSQSHGQGQGQDFVSIKNNPLHQTAIPLLAVASTGTGPGVVPALRSDTDIEQDYAPIDTPVPPTISRRETSLESSTPLQLKPKSNSTNTNTIDGPPHSISASRTTSPPPPPLPPNSPPYANPTSPTPAVPPHLSSRPSQTQTDETHSTFSFVHVPSLGCSPSMAYLSSFETTSTRPSNPIITPLPTTTTHSVVPVQVPAPITVPVSVMNHHHTQPSPTSATASITSPIKNKMKRSTSRTPSSNATVSLNSTQHQPQPQSSEINHTSIAIDEWGLPSTTDLMRAAALPVISESGIRVTFGTLFARERVIVVFIRHFWCPLCHDYMTSVVSSVKKIPELMIQKTRTGTRTRTRDGYGTNVEDEKSQSQKKNVPIKLIVISNGSHTMIGKYKQIFGKGFALEVYSDPSLAVYTALGMGKDPTSLPSYNNNNNNQDQQNVSANTHSYGRSRSKSKQVAQAYPLTDTDEFGVKSDSCIERNCKDDNTTTRGGGYVKHGIMSGIAMVFVRALKVGMPVWEKGGDLNQLGGEFVFGPGLTCKYAHRMVTTKGHSPFEDVLRAAGIVMPTSDHTPLPSLSVKEKGKDYEEKNRHREEQSMTLSSTHQSRSTRGRVIDNNIPQIVSQHQSPTRIPQSQSQSRSHTPEGKRSHRRRRSVTRTSVTSVGVIPVSAPMQVNAPVGSILVASPSLSSSLSPTRGKEKRSTTDSRSSTPASNGTKAHIISQKSVPKKSLDCVTTMVITKSDDEMWMEDRHTSLQRIKEKKNSRRGLPVDELVQVQVQDKERIERGSTSTRRALERTFSQPTEGTGTRRDLSFGMTIQREKSGIKASSSRRDGDDDDIVLLGRETRMKVNLSRDNSTRKEQERARERERERGRQQVLPVTMNNFGRVHVEDDVDTETVSDKTLVHR